MNYFRLLLIGFMVSFCTYSGASELSKSFNKKLYEEVTSSAPSFKKLDTIKLLLNRGANPNAQFDDKTIVMYAIDNVTDRTSKKIVKYLLKRNNDNPNFIAKNGMNAYTYAAAKGNYNALELFKKLVKPQRDAYGMTPDDYIDENLQYRQQNYRILKKIREDRLANYKNQLLEKKIQKFERLPSKKELEELELEEWEIIEPKGP